MRWYFLFPRSPQSLAVPAYRDSALPLLGLHQLDILPTPKMPDILTVPHSSKLTLQEYLEPIMTRQLNRKQTLLLAPLIITTYALFLAQSVTITVAQENDLDLLDPYVEGEKWPPEEGFSDGLLGNRYFEGGFHMARPKSELLREVSDWTSGVRLELNLPILEHLDWKILFHVNQFRVTYQTASQPSTLTAA